MTILTKRNKIAIPEGEELQGTPVDGGVTVVYKGRFGKLLEIEYEPIYEQVKMEGMDVQEETVKTNRH